MIPVTLQEVIEKVNVQRLRGRVIPLEPGDDQEVRKFINVLLKSKYSRNDSGKLRTDDEFIKSIVEFVDGPNINLDDAYICLNAGKAKDLAEVYKMASQRMRDHVVTEIIGSGGYSLTFSGTHRRWGTEHAVKIVNPTDRARGYLEDKGLSVGEVTSILENRSAAISDTAQAVHCPGLQTFIYSYIGEEWLVIVERKLDKTLGQAVEESKSRLPFAPRLALSYVKEMTGMVAALHHMKNPKFPDGNYHGDLSLSNVMLDKAGWIYLIDFGITSLLCQGMSVQFRPPEMFPWHPNSIDPYAHDAQTMQAADKWGLGVLACYIFTGEMPFEVKMKKPLENASLKKREAYERAVYDSITKTTSEQIYQRLAPKLKGYFSKDFKGLQTEDPLFEQVVNAIDEELKEYVTKMLCQNPNERMDFMTWINGSVRRQMIMTNIPGQYNGNAEIPPYLLKFPEIFRKTE